MNRLMTTEAACALRGFVEHVGSGRRESFRTTALFPRLSSPNNPSRPATAARKKEERGMTGALRPAAHPERPGNWGARHALGHAGSMELRTSAKEG